MTQNLPLPLLTDEYELAMADSYLAAGHGRHDRARSSSASGDCRRSAGI